ncbi:MAG: ABC transporter ATP-binding protein [Burkholderiaceae bacterium]|jgi:iron(III) transport system ATP-binding protein
MIGVEIKSLTKAYLKRSAPVIANLNLRIPGSQVTVLLGPSGCGKTTLLRLIAGLEAVDQGHICIEGEEVQNKPANARGVGMVFQNYALFPHMTVFDNVAYGLRSQGIKGEAIERRVQQALKAVSLEAYAQRMPSQLSGGQQQRVALARALVLEPKLVLFDEPLSNLDTQLRKTVRRSIRALQESLGLTVIYVTHDQDEALRIADHIVLMDQGRIVQEGNPSSMFTSPASEFAAQFMAQAHCVDGHIDRDHHVCWGDLVLGSHPGVGEGPCRIALLPNTWELITPQGTAPVLPGVMESRPGPIQGVAGQALGSPGLIRGQVGRIEFAGLFCDLEVLAAQIPEGAVWVRSSIQTFKRGDLVELQIQPGRWFVYPRAPSNKQG